MARKIDTMKAELVGEVLSLSELENYMSGYNFSLIESENDDENEILKFTNYKSQIWIESEND